MLDLNDCEASEQDIAFMTQDIRPIDVLLNQFSIAGLSGVEHSLEGDVVQTLDTMVRDHCELGAKVTIPFASFI